MKWRGTKISKSVVDLDDPNRAAILARQKERSNWVASRVGLPTIGSKLLNRHGIEWVVQGHEPIPTYDSLHRWRQGDIQPQSDMYPLLATRNLSPDLVEFMRAVNRCTTKSFAIVDTMPGRRDDGHVPGGNSIDTLCHPEANIVFLDAARVHETVIAHEFGHAWVQYVDECEDLRTLEDASDPARMRQVGFIQSFVLDLKVNDLLRRKGFDMSPIIDDQAQSLIQLAAALQSGYRAKLPREEVFMALLVADEMIQLERNSSTDLARVGQSLETIRDSLAPLADLAETMADSVRKHGYESREAIVACIDECLLASFEHCGDSIDIDRELVLINAPEPDLDKFPDWLPLLPPRVKCQVGQHMARNGVSSDWSESINPSVTGRARVSFWSPEHDKRCEILLSQEIGPPTRYTGMPEIVAENLAMKHRNQFGDYQLFGGPPHANPLSHSNLAAFFPGEPNPGLHGQTACLPKPPGALKPTFPKRPYMAGLGRFLTSVREAEWVSGEHPYAYALSNPVTYVDPSGLETCEEVRDECLQRANNKRNACARDAFNDYAKELKHCNTLSGRARTACNIAANLIFEARIAACVTKTQPRFNLCIVQYELCEHGRDLARGVVCLTIVAGGTYCLYQIAKDVGGTMAGCPEVVAIP